MEQPTPTSSKRFWRVYEGNAMKTSLLISHAITSLHFGTGAGLSDIDQPTARELASGLPIAPGSSLKGCLRDRCADEQTATEVFGPREKPEEHAGSLQVHDLRLLCLPIRSLKGVFAWVTAPYALERLNRDLDLCGLPAVPIPSLPDVAQCIVGADSALPLEPRGADIVLQDFDLTATPDTTGTIAALVSTLAVVAPAAGRRLCVVHDDVLTFFCSASLQVDARIALGEQSKTVKKGGLWYEESLPPETIMVAPITAAPPKKVSKTDDEIMSTVTSLIARPIQAGGNASTGRGLLRLRLAGTASESTGGSHANA
jgi:CRISPR-associated protein Cmr4